MVGDCSRQDFRQTLFILGAPTIGFVGGWAATRLVLRCEAARRTYIIDCTITIVLEQAPGPFHAPFFRLSHWFTGVRFCLNIAARNFNDLGIIASSRFMLLGRFPFRSLQHRTWSDNGQMY